jgi:primary-amine oxidase
MRWVWLATYCFVLSYLSSAQAGPAVHPLDALSKDEIVATVELLKARGKISESTRFPIIDIKEPAKDKVAGPAAGVPIRREAFVVAYERASNRTFEALVDLKAKTVTSRKEIRGVQPSLVQDAAKILEQAIRADATLSAALIQFTAKV